jgi:hypothetical protein
VAAPWQGTAAGLPFNATALLAENAGFGGKIVMQLGMRLSALVRTHRDSPP